MFKSITNDQFAWLVIKYNNMVTCLGENPRDGSGVHIDGNNVTIDGLYAGRIGVDSVSDFAECNLASELLYEFAAHYNYGYTNKQDA